MQVSKATENYLETILILTRMQEGVHAADICSYLGYSRPTVSVVLKQMKEAGLVTVDEMNHITLTEEGRQIAEQIYERHNVIAEMLVRLGVSEQTAHDDACKIEHEISEESFRCLKTHFDAFLSDEKVRQ